MTKSQLASPALPTVQHHLLLKITYLTLALYLLLTLLLTLELSLALTQYLANPLVAAHLHKIAKNYRQI